jgi:hypothetical protein
VGNCFPGLEFDLRNLERRFFPFLEVNIGDNEISVVSVDFISVEAQANSGKMTAATAAAYREVGLGVSTGQDWTVSKIRGTFGPLGKHSIKIADLRVPSIGANRLPPDAWTAIRLLTEDSEVQLTLNQGNRTVDLAGKRARYLDDNGALAEMFLPGELTQSLCSPWTHDFRDCACFYWASNHPDIVLPPLPTPPPNTPAINTYVPWERRDRGLDTLPTPAKIEPGPELRHYEINHKWQTLNFVLESRETVTPYMPGSFSAPKLANKNALLTHLRYAAGVELAVIHEYLAAAYSLKVTNIPRTAQNDVRAARAEILRITYGEMRHVRAVNDVLRSLDPAGYEPALCVASQVPNPTIKQFRNVEPHVADQNTIDAFIEIERPSDGVDGLYASILVTLEDMATEEIVQIIRSVIADGETHFETFSYVKEWLHRHPESDYLINQNATIAPAGNSSHQKLQTQYLNLLEQLYRGYTLGIPSGAANINTARNEMIGPTGLDHAAAILAGEGFLVSFNAISDKRFQPVNPPPDLK